MDRAARQSRDVGQEKQMQTFDDIDEFRKSDEVMEFADEWLQEARADNPAGKRHMTLSLCQVHHQHEALGIILTLLDKAQDEDDVCEQIALGPVWELVEWAKTDFVPILREAVLRHPLFELCTRGRRKHPDSPRWAEI